MFKLPIERLIIIGFTLVAGLAVGMIGFGPTIATAIPNQDQAPTPVYSVNENGQSYGSALYANSIDEEPDLIKARGVDGNTGYVRAVDLYRDEPKTPEEALEKMRKAPSIKKIPLYAVDGKTVVGTFHIKNNKPQMIKLDDQKGNDR